MFLYIIVLSPRVCRVSSASVLGSNVGAHIHVDHVSLRRRLRDSLRDTFHRGDLRLSHRMCLLVRRRPQNLRHIQKRSDPHNGDLLQLDSTSLNNASSFDVIVNIVSAAISPKFKQWPVYRLNNNYPNRR